jgi:hypothetical protein
VHSGKVIVPLDVIVCTGSGANKTRAIFLMKNAFAYFPCREEKMKLDHSDIIKSSVHFLTAAGKII